ncbi:hypothetical protein A3C32_04060 [Candidatus Daviesbacteria bacterium RIFCSPHIGHO2_02_FULL_41_14]|uniref:UDP-N-acetylmuramoyl-tripeptide--D-alanyl-D-alanine ligase n=1 Tax=Candidatus Daviesbacteria bacterium RIFCSPLOWO2_01_FULL_40_24 TaxID=1797787 RepID=A0A1F5MJ51_9BACT|nr:MAG: hypothetical protein A2780_00460 [Candidatus Daviesbacteria bacterium RIFCSPHIGHO2_01_FULL_41_45]OGE34489.1 MAG: hypothetical protein A3C32_04060 [Candidatus Daviesbacteria bacterium RIFCSPHIGHO2_02_FULL_41_14]OGE65401.1 MAG: hypothetical protein A3B49_00755 [Candidatus Daviesbacteria bacterium RIFCSPLOWO2_01_FULL_40_24]
MIINEHPVWKNIHPFKKPLHLLRIHLARNMARIYPRSIFIGITGTVGKTTTVNLSQAVLSQKIKVLSTKDNLDSVFNIPITILKVRPNIKKVILEMGIEYKGEMDFYLSLVRPATAIVTRIAYQHTEFLQGVEEIAKEKGKLIAQLPKEGSAILNWDDVRVRSMAELTDAKVIFFGTNPKQCHVWGGNIKTANYQTVFELNYGVERVEIRLNLLGRHFVTAALAAAALGIDNGLSLINIKKGLESVKPAPHRLEAFEGSGGWTVLDDTYNASPVSVEEAINLLCELPARKRFVVLGEMRELGEFNDKMHRSVAQKIYKEKVDFVLLGGGNAQIIADELIKLGYPTDRLESNLSHSQIVGSLLKNAKKGDLILVKGARAVKLNEVVERITKK